MVLKLSKTEFEQLQEELHEIRMERLSFTLRFCTWIHNRMHPDMFKRYPQKFLPEPIACD
ncbi:MAG: hypothetical protein Q7S92_07185 [Candidatus Diapherotrites archaeon]|nr:hypothetical protein [Candidatus Diapherotrites archaeon]